MNTDSLSHARVQGLSPGRALWWQQMLAIQSHLADFPSSWGEAKLAVPLRGRSSVCNCIRGFGLIFARIIQTVPMQHLLSNLKPARAL